ncbi:DNA-dependent metalloprotease SPRTN-like [Erinaceus europaeus]|uniref:DNA-dependent metalloprotease SPRTN n=1 Tax=Erinaceus europaeus TaxID=9365 RepID=A0A1S3A3W3_ERIEU|nr:DNA-dependent metalloprotease SPRTN-like [Erinaceus europaeus]
MDEDLVLALPRQKERRLQAPELSWGQKRNEAQEGGQAGEQYEPPGPLSLVDASWELLDPTPDLQDLFVQYNNRFFWGQLREVEVKWSLRMTLCAGICSYEGKGGMCSIRLSEPLLKLRPRRDLVETLLHEMIHAYLFVTNNDKDWEGHGPEFCKHMHRINCLTGANITIRHTFHEEVDEYRRHWWRCNGPCQHSKPYYGYVRRAINRAPSARDCWWAKHQKTCGGTYIKIREPKNYSKKGKGKTKLGKDSISTGENKDKPHKDERQPLIPLSEKGYILRETNSSPSTGKFVTSHTISKSHDLLSQDHTANEIRPNFKTEVEIEQNGSNEKTSFVVSPLLNTSHQNVLSHNFLRVSVADQITFKGVDESPVKSLTVDDITKSSVSSHSRKRFKSSKISLRNSLKAVELTSVTTSQDGKGPEDKFPNKKPRLEDRHAFDIAFIKEEQSQSDGNDPKCSSHPVAENQKRGGSFRRYKVVYCPVCQNEVLESQINEHLDWCLEGDSIKAKS